MTAAPLHALNALFRPIAVEFPLRLTDVSAWVEHIPFALNLVDLVRPARLVELGVHAGDSYCAMCQAVTRLRLDTRCYGVDTWRGDPQAGTYGETVLDDLRRYHDPLYSSFSRLVQSTFDEAAVHFADGAIDLLHIDGFHAVETVRHDFETWIRKLAPRAVVLFHDTNVREGGFGVWKLWTDLASSHRWSFEFSHGHGLGVLAPGEVPPALQPLFEASAEDARELREVYASLGGNIERARRLRSAIRDVERLTREVADGARVRDEARSEAEALRASRLGAEQTFEELARERREISALLRDVAEAGRSMTDAKRWATATEQELDAAREELASTRRDLATITGSRAWRLLQAYRGARDTLLRRR